MHYILSKTRLNTNYNRITHQLKNTAALQHCLATYFQHPYLVVTTQIKSQEDLLIQAHYTYEALFNDQPVTLDITLMQSTSQTDYCFDLYFKVSPQSTLATETNHVIKRYITDGLDALRASYNGTWVIDDKDLHFSILR